MGRYRKIDTRIWNDSKFTALSNEGKLVFLFLLTHPHMTSLGAMRGTMAGLASELGWGVKAFREAFQEGFRKGLVEHDEEACFIGIPKFLKYNGPESPNVVKSWRDSVDLIPECLLKVQLMKRVKGFAEGLPEAFAKALPEAFRKGMPNPEQEQEQEPEQEQDIPPEVPRGGRVRFSPPSLEEVADYCRERNNSIDPQRFINHYTSNGWRVGKTKMCDWQAAVRTWESNTPPGGQATPSRRSEAMDFTLGDSAQ